MRILCLGDVVGSPGKELLVARLPAFREEHDVDFCIVNIENIVDGAGVNTSSFRAVRNAGADVCTTGDHVFKRADILKLFEKEKERLLRPLNYPKEAAGPGLTVVDDVAVINVVGRVFMDPADDPFRAVDEALAKIDAKVVVVDMHGEATSEKRAMGWHLDGRVSIMYGTHTHVPTADDQVLPQGTAYVTDIGMTGAYESVIGREWQNVLKTFRTRMYAPFHIATGDVRSCGILADVDENTGRARSVERVTIRP